MTELTVVDSTRLCPRCHKRMVFEVGQHEDTGTNVAVHTCWSCDYAEADLAWPPRRRGPVVLAEIGQADE